MRLEIPMELASLEKTNHKGSNSGSLRNKGGSVARAIFRDTE
jgi:hypothetical protein